MLPVDVVNAENERLQSLLNKDADALGSLLSKNLTYIHSNGKVDYYDDVINKIKSSFQYNKLERSKLSVQIINNEVAIMTGVLDVEFKRNENYIIQKMTAVVTQVWEKNDGVIQLCAYHVSKLD